MDSTSLITSSKRWMHAGLAAFVKNTDMDFAVHHFGVATEHAMKGYLSSIHPVLIVQGKDFASLLHATGNAARTPVGRADVRTIESADMFQRSNQLLKKQLPVSEATFKDLMNARNGVSHLGEHVPGQVRKHLTTAIGIVDHLLNELAVQLPGYWDTYLDLHDELLQKRADELKIAYKAKITAAKVFAKSRLGGMDPRDFSRVKAELSWLGVDENELVTCPACGAEGHLTGYYRMDRVDGGGSIDFDTEDWPDVSKGEWMVVIAPDRFDCPVCHLHLGVGEFELAGLPTLIRTNHDPAAWAPGEEQGDWEPEEEDRRNPWHGFPASDL